MKSQMSDEEVAEAEKSMRGDQEAQQARMQEMKAQQAQLVCLGAQTEEKGKRILHFKLARPEGVCQHPLFDFRPFPNCMYMQMREAAEAVKVMTDAEKNALKDKMLPEVRWSLL